MINYPAAAQDPYGCIVFYNGASRLFTDYTSTDGNSSRHYNNNPAQTYYVRYGSLDPNCGILVDYNTPYGGGCTVDGVNSGGLARRISSDTCSLPIDDYIPYLMVITAAAAVGLLKRTSLLVIK
ncbi:hypothetical protein ACS5PU_12770 [Pedobacter sp. GSP4]|uniref:hypothetical protein n=1 Tax=Pedobacter sp. GSP4 TaxID=3453716 RepID=UPI003EEB2443